MPVAPASRSFATYVFVTTGQRVEPPMAQVRCILHGCRMAPAPALSFRSASRPSRGWQEDCTSIHCKGQSAELPFPHRRLFPDAGCPVL
jgi:hypothetical protein